MCVLLGSMVSEMSGKQQSSEHTRDSDLGHVGSELKDLALSLASSKEVYGGLCSPLANHAVGALQAQGLIPGQVPDRGGQPTTQSTRVPNQVMRRGFTIPLLPPNKLTCSRQRK